MGEVITVSTDQSGQNYNNGLNREIIHRLRYGQRHALHRFILNHNKHQLYRLVDFDTGDEFECITARTIFLHLGLDVLNGPPIQHMYNLVRGSQNFVNIGGRLLHLKDRDVNGGITVIETSSEKVRNMRLERAQQRQIERKLRQRFKHVITLKGLKPCPATENLVGCSPIEFREHLRKQWKSGMSWENYGLVDGWGMDHIIPVSKFDLRDPLEQKKCFHYTNIQPLWRRENGRKYNKIIIPSP